jgi:transposase
LGRIVAGWPAEESRHAEPVRAIDASASSPRRWQEVGPRRRSRRRRVGRSTVRRWVGAAAAPVEGRFEAKPMRGGPGPTIRDEGEAALKRLVAADNHLTLAKHRERLERDTGVRAHPWTVGRTFWRLGLARKKEEPARGRAGRGRGRGGAAGLA